jgi:hypothetical protein
MLESDHEKVMHSQQYFYFFLFLRKNCYEYIEKAEKLLIMAHPLLNEGNHDDANTWKVQQICTTV